MTGLTPDQLDRPAGLPTGVPAPPLRLAYITPEFVTEPSYAGGLANYLGRATVALAEAGHDVHVFTRSTEGDEVIQFHGVHVHRVVPLWDRRRLLDHVDPWIPRSYYNPYQDVKAAWKLKQRWAGLHRRQPFDLVQVANVMGVGLFFRHVRSLPVVTRLSSFRPAWDTAAGIHVNGSVRLRWWLEKTSIRGTRFNYAPSHFVAEATAQHYGIPSVDVIETPFFEDAVAMDDAHRQKHLRDQPYVLFFGRLTQMKGAHVLAQALPRLLEHFPEMHVVFIGGQGPAPGGGAMREYIRGLLAPYSERVQLFEPMRHEHLYPYVQHAKVVALPSLIDNLPNTCLEAMALGRPVVATHGSCFEQLIRDGHSGFLTAPGDVAALQEVLARAWTMTDEQRMAMGQSAQQRIDLLRPPTAIPRLIRYYRDVMGQFRTAGPTRGKQA